MTRTLLATTLFAALAAPAFAAQPAAPVATESYHYGMPLDVRKVVALSLIHISEPTRPY